MQGEALDAILSSPLNRGLAADIARRLRTAIVHGYFGPGERLREEALAKSLGVSRGPVREALSQLEREGLVVIQRNRGTFFARLTREDAETLDPATAFDELAARWRPILDAFDECGVDVCYEVHPGEDLCDGASFEMFLDRVGHHARANLLYDPSHFVLQQLDYLAYIDIYHERIKAFHVKDAEFRPNGRAGVYGSYSGWADRPGRFRSLGDGDVDFGAIFTQLSVHNYDSWAVLEWECAIKNREDGAREGAPFIQKHLINVSQTTFDDFIDQDRRWIVRELAQLPFPAVDPLADAEVAG